MKTLALAFLLFVQTPAVVDTIEFSGISRSALSSELQADIQNLQGRPYKAEEAERLLDRIRSETRSGKAAKIKTSGLDTGHVTVVFSEGPEKEYFVDSVEISGVRETAVSMALRLEILGLAGHVLNEAEAERLRSSLVKELGDGFNATWRTAKVKAGSAHLTLTFDVFRPPWLPFRGPDGYLSYHPKLNLSAVALLPVWDDSPDGNLEITVGDHRPVGPKSSVKREASQKFIFGLANSGDDLIERYKGFSLAYETRRAATNRVGLRIEYSAYGSRWKSQVETATAALPEFDLYRARHTLEPSVAVALTRDLYVTAGVRWVDLELVLPTGSVSPSANAGLGGIHYRRAFASPDHDTHDVQFGYTVAAAADSLDSDYIYTRHFWNLNYTLAHSKAALSLRLSGGRITGKAPLFERFSLGNTETLRGWNRFDLAPRGGDRMTHGSLDWEYQGFKAFYDTGTVWDTGNPIHLRSSIGVGVGKKRSALFLAFRVDGAHLKPTILLMLK